MKKQRRKHTAEFKARVALEAIRGIKTFIDNVIIERFWRTIKYDDIYLKSYTTPLELEKGIQQFIGRYNMVRPHQALSGATPDEIFNQLMERVV